ncbi:MAG: phosphoglucosamine mutase [Candidatus Omnitrophica bacterium]|nr:phosphoglucosamine mutase [Candidatus Omnitrophota bacterium]
MEKLFGTDGIRGEVGKYPLTQEAVFAIGKTLGKWLKQIHPQEKKLKVILGKDTRESGDELEAALLAGVMQEKIEAVRLGTCPTPTVAYLTILLKAQLGIAISASHNPGSDNGIKFFGHDGYKLFPEAEKLIEGIFSKSYANSTPTKSANQVFADELDYFPAYLEFVKKSLNGQSLKGLKIVLDCAYGSFSEVAPRVFRALGAEVIVLHNEPDGTNINVNCGTLYPQLMSKAILEHKAALGIAFDGDGDRVIAGDENGVILDGDQIMAILGKYLLEEQRLPGKLIISTQMSNIGFEILLQQMGIRLIRTEVGDKYVLQEMLKQHAVLGGEQSGHIIILGRSTTGDGLIAALELIKVMLKRKKRLSALNADFEKFPQILVNVRVKQKKPFSHIPGLEEALECCQTELGKKGRILLRYSGTEKLARIMIEGKTQTQVKDMADSLAVIIRNDIGEDR